MVIKLGQIAFSLPPLAERELLAGGRRQSFFWLRGALALVTGVQAYEIINRGLVATAGPGGPFVGGGQILREMSGLLFVVALLMGLMAADSINRERREGTLGLLLLTGLKPSQIVFGKLLSCGVTSFMILLGAVPAVMFPVLVGGARGADGVMAGLGVLNTLFVSLAAGLWMSALFPQRTHAVLATLMLIGFLAFGAELAGAALFGQRAVPVMRLLGLEGWLTATSQSLPLGVRMGLFAIWLLFTHATGQFLLFLASETLSANWRDKPERHRRPPPPPDPYADWTHRVPPVIHPRGNPDFLAALPPTPLPDPRPWDAEPVRWRVEQLGSVRGVLWLSILASFAAQFGVVGSYASASSSASAIWGLFSFAGVMVMVVASALLAWAGARFFQQSIRQQDLELLLTTPLGSADILRGQWRVLWRTLQWPLVVVLAPALPAGIAIAYDLAHGRAYSMGDMLPPFLVGINLALEALAVCWTGVYFGLRSRNLISAVTWTVGLAQVLPLLIGIAGLWGWAALGGEEIRGLMPGLRLSPVVLVLLFFGLKNVGLLLWMPWQLRKQLRLGGAAHRRQR